MTEVDADGVADDTPFVSACFPLRYHLDLLKYLHCRRNEIQTITYADLPWEDDYNVEQNYADEFRRWNQQVKQGSIDRKKIYLLLQHDVDAFPERAHVILRQEEQLGLRSNVMIFNRRLNRRRLLATGELEQRDYPVDVEFLCSLQNQGFVIGYHSNAYEWSGFDPAKAADIFERDISELRQRFRIEFFCPHGGVRDAQGRSNAAIDIPPTLRRSLRWVLNRHTVRFHGTFSDGGMNAIHVDHSKRDLENFIHNMEPGKRYRILTHPQYYDESFTILPQLAGAAWYGAILERYSGNSDREIWLDKCIDPDR